MKSLTYCMGAIIVALMLEWLVYPFHQQLGDMWIPLCFVIGFVCGILGQVMATRD